MPALAGGGEHACLHLHTESRRTEDRDIKPAGVKRQTTTELHSFTFYALKIAIYPSYVDARPRGGMFENSCTAVAGVVWNKLSSTPELRRARIFVDPATTCACTGSHREAMYCCCTIARRMRGLFSWPHRRKKRRSWRHNCYSQQQLAVPTLERKSTNNSSSRSAHDPVMTDSNIKHTVDYRTVGLSGHILANISGDRYSGRKSQSMRC